MDHLYLFFSAFVLLFAITIWIVYYFIIVKNKARARNCTATTLGTVTRYSMIQYNEQSLPVVEYYVDGKAYEVVGPKLQFTLKTTYSTSWNSANSEVESNLESSDQLPDHLEVTVKKNSMASRTVSSLQKLYPVGKTGVRVFYNPKKPKEAFVERLVEAPPILSGALLLAGIITTVTTIVFLILAFNPR
ncbi:DUF3592 domain-containing protein [Guggenheimella bovis]